MSKPSLPVGGRGKIAPYTTTHYRIPIAIKPHVQELANEYKRLVLEGIVEPDTEFRVALPNEAQTLPPLEETLAIAEEILSKKKSAAISLAKLVSALYNVSIDPKQFKG